MKKKNFSEMSEEELQKFLKTLKALTAVFAGGIITLLVALTFLTVMGGFNILILIPLGLFPLLFINYKKIDEIKKELNARKINKAI